jgi:hypothetical protein
MSDGTWVFVPTAGPNSKYVVQAASAEDPLGAVVVADRIIMSGIHADRPAPSGLNTGSLYLETDVASGTLFRSDGADWVQVAPGIADAVEIRRAYKPTDETVTGSTTLQNDDHLSVSLQPSATYHFRASLPWTAGAGTAGLKVALGGNATVTNLRAVIRIATIAGTGSGIVTALASAVGANGAGPEVAEIDGAIEVNTGGTFLVQWAQNTSDGTNGTNGTTVQRGASLVVTRLP